ncbi:diacylglycerol O-acyltransferase 2-like protein 6 [Perognathus longimembris pacificus]|uniref:diacylglycerol O-acyltransferase 2-like protein 6 n=1 Tax=Perognathus longimembris pacificus TaxID=214514 RepID=UPI002018CDCC|nr:diacylglycerol O-acyltransferase 2-like protein 6 [Perognathus longimembris pacificus]
MTFSRLDLQEGLRTFSVLQLLPFSVSLGIVSILILPCLLFTKYWFLTVLTYAWFIYDWNTHGQGGRHSAWLRHWTIWKYFQSYFPIKLVKTHDLSPKHNYIIGNHPHGMLSHGAFINFSTEATGFSQIFPSITPFLATLKWIFWIPLLREYVMSLGFSPVSESSLRYKLTHNGLGNAVVIVVGGASEVPFCQPGATTVYLKNHKGFVRLALQTGAFLVPSYSFGENDAYALKTFSEGTWIRFFQKYYQKIIKSFSGLNICLFYGRGLTRGSWGFLPFNRPITTVVGEPLPVPKTNKPNKETVDKYHALYINALRKLFDQYKVECGLSETQELTVI